MKRSKRKISLFNFLLLISIASGIIVFFVNNILALNRLSMENDIKRTELNKVITINNTLKTDIERFTTFDRIKPIAVDKLNMTFPKNKISAINLTKSEIEK